MLFHYVKRRHRPYKYMYESIVSTRTLILVCIGLLVLTGVTIGVSYIELGPLHTPVGLGIAGVKAALILMYFMHLRGSSGLTRLTVAAGILWLGILLVGTLDDVISRGWLVPDR
jgi:cytochrome c oxidase subunit IV